MGILDRIHPVEELDPYLKILVYGEPGAGKTIFACDSPRPLLIDVDHDGHVSLANHPDLFPKVQVLQVESYNDLDEVFWEIRKGNVTAVDGEPVETVIIDTISELQRKNMDALLIKLHERDNARNAYRPQQTDYKESGEMLRRLVTSFRDLECHLVVVAHRTEDKEDNGTLTIRPQVTPALANTLKGMFSIQGYMTYDVDQWERSDVFVNFLQVRQSRRVEAKTRVGGLDPKIANPTMQMLLDAYERQRETAQATKQAVPSTS